MANTRITLPPEQSKALDDAWQASIDAWQAGEPDRALAIAAQAWQALPEPATRVEFSEALALTTTKYAIANDRLAEARLWLQLARESYGSDVADITRANLDFQQACLEYRAGDPDLAYRLFDAVARYSGQRFFSSSDPQYWKFYREQKARLGSQLPADPLLPSPSGGSGKTRELSAAEEAQIQQLVDRANDLDDEDRYAESEPLLLEALQLIPDPKEQSGLSVQVYGALGDDYWSQGRLPQAENALRFALLCSGGLTNPFIWMRLGQTLYDQHGVTDESVDALLRAYMLDGAQVFETEDPKYLGVLKRQNLID